MRNIILATSLSVAAVTGVVASSPAAAKQYTVLEPLPADIVGNLTVASVDVTLGVDAAEMITKHDAKAAEKRVAGKLARINASGDASVGASATTAETIDGDQYATIPFTQMFPRVMQDVTRKWGLTGGRPVKLLVTIDEFKTANAGMALLIGSSDNLSGQVEVQDAASGAKLGRFAVKVRNGHGGWGGLLIRGGGIREKLSEEFALESSRVLTGRKSLKIKAKTASN